MSTPTATYRAPAALNRIRWRAGGAALCRIYDFRFNHEALFEAFMALIGPTMARGFDEVAALPEGQRLLRDKPDLLALLSDDDYLASLPAGSFGAAYRDFLQQHRLDAGVFDARTVIQPIIDRNQWGDDFGYLIHRGTVLHDVFHVLGGYGADAGGELGNLGFTHGQLPNCRMTAVLGVIFCAIIGGAGWRRKRQYWREAVARGRNATNLMAAHFEELLAEPLTEVRARLDITPTDVAHPDGHFFSRWQLPLIHQQTPFEPWDYETTAMASTAS
jgi:ubiquinone biosynthesis protein COQ4